MSNDWLYNKGDWMKEYAARIAPIIEYYGITIQPDDYERGSVERSVWEMIVEKMEHLAHDNATLQAELATVSTTDTADTIDLEDVLDNFVYQVDPDVFYMPRVHVYGLIDGLKAQRAETQRLRGLLRKGNAGE